MTGTVPNATTAVVAGTVTTAAQGNITSVGTLTSLAVTGNATANNFIATTIVNGASFTGGLVSVTGTVTGSQFNGSGAGLSSIPGANVSGAVSFATTANAVAGANVSGAVSFATTANAVAGANVSGTVANATTAVVAGTVTANAQANITSVGTLSSLTVTANATANNFIATTIVNAASHTGGLVSVTGQITGSQFNGSGAGLTSIPGANVSGAVAFATTANAVAGANVSGTVASATLATFATTANAVAGANVSGAVSFATTANAVAGANVSGAVSFATTANAVAGANVSGTVANATTAVVAGTVTTAAQGNITSLGTITNLTVNNATTAITNAAGNAVGNIGASGAFFNRLFAQATTALYADLAEMYTTDAEYEPGTVLVFGGNQEVTTSTVTHDHRVAGVVSTNPAHIMNAGLQGEHTVEVALVGRVPVSVIGNISAGDRVVTSNRAGVAEALDMTRYQPGVIIGKALQSYSGNGVGVIEVVVGRL